MDVQDYIYEVYKEGSFSKAARNLYVSQPALSTAVKRVETDLGITIFDRSASPIALTEEGKIYIQAIESIRAVNRSMLEQIEDIATLSTGDVVVSGENYVSSFILPPILMRFSASYPGVNVHLVESNMPDLHTQLLSNHIDLLIAHDFDEQYFDSVDLFSETILLAVPVSLPINAQLSSYALTGKDILKGKHLSDTTEGVDLNHFKNEEFLMLKQGNDMNKRSHLLCQRSDFIPKVRIELDQLITSYNLACAGMGIAFVSDVLVQNALKDGCIYYKINARHTTRIMRIGFKKNHYQSKAVKAFIETSKTYYQK